MYYLSYAQLANWKQKRELAKEKKNHETWIQSIVILVILIITITNFKILTTVENNVHIPNKGYKKRKEKIHCCIIVLLFINLIFILVCFYFFCGSFAVYIIELNRNVYNRFNNNNNGV